MDRSVAYVCRYRPTLIVNDAAEYTACLLVLHSEQVFDERCGVFLISCFLFFEFELYYIHGGPPNGTRLVRPTAATIHLSLIHI